MEVDKRPHLQWPGPYVPAIENVLKDIPAVEKLFRTMNVPFKTRYGEEVQSDCVTIFGGFLRWIVEEVTSGLHPTFRSFLKYNSDIDIIVDDHTGCCDKLRQYFRELIENGAIIEYSGMAYGDIEPAKVSINLEKDLLIYGNYILWLPVMQDTSNNVTTKFIGSRVERHIVIEQPSKVRKGVSFADALKFKQGGETSEDPERTKTDETRERTGEERPGKIKTDEAQEPKEWTGSRVVSKVTPANIIKILDRKPVGWVKLDISYGCRQRVTDFTVNILRWPRIRAGTFWVQALSDIIGRRIIPSGAEIQFKTCYRLVKLIRRGYTFGVGDKSDCIALAQYLNVVREPHIGKRSQNRSHQLIGRAFTEDTNAPSTIKVSNKGRYVFAPGCGHNIIPSTLHVPTVIDREYLSTLDEYRQLCVLAGLSSERSSELSSELSSEPPKVSTDDASCEWTVANEVPFEWSVAENVPPTVSNTNDYSYLKHTDCSELDDSTEEVDENKISHAKEPLTVYKGAEVAGTGHIVCVMLRIPVGTPIKMYYGTYICESAEVVGIYKYPLTPINDAIAEKKMTIQSTYDATFKYATDGIIHSEVHARHGGAIIPLREKSNHGVYAYETALDAWAHFGSQTKYGL